MGTAYGSQTQTFFHSIQPCTSSLSPPVNPVDAPSLNTKISPQNLVGEVLSDTGWPIGSRGFANIYRTTWFHNGKETRVAVKVLKVPQFEHEGDHNVAEVMTKRLQHEISIWTCLEHRNILAFYGMIPHFGPTGTHGMVSPWIDNGDLSCYLTKHQTLSSVERLQIITQIADGLSYLHWNDIIHGDLTGKNVPTGDSRRVYICHFGLSSIWGDPNHTACQTTSTVKFNLQWTAPKIMISNLWPTKHTDIYSLASVILQA